MNWGLFGSVCSIDITFDAEQNRKTAALGKDKKGERAFIFTDGEDVMGTAVVSMRPGKKMDHQGNQGRAHWSGGYAPRQVTVL
eukprot:Skav207806  [mRNA]  locus=scaffold381:210205:215056:+ [translate_table: standard]